MPIVGSIYGGGVTSSGEGGGGVATYAIRYDVDSGDKDISYVGKAVTGSEDSDPVWQISKLIEGSLTQHYVGGEPAFAHVWNNRESLSYS